jgi:Tfp pilus assembly protein PilV
MRAARRQEHSGAGISRLRSEGGMTIVETMVAMVILLTGLLSTFLLVDVANSGQSRSKAREGATNLARELLEQGRKTRYTTIGQTDWFKPTLQSLQGGSGTVSSPTGASQQTTVARRGYSYTVTASWCSVDDGRDGYGSHATGSWCPDSSSTASSDTQPEDMKRVLVKVAYSVNGKAQPSVLLTAGFGPSGNGIGPNTTLVVQSTTPPSSVGNPPVITSTSTTSVTVRATSQGAYDMKFSVNGVGQTSGVTNNNNGTWDFAWPISSLKDGTYTIGATAVDAIGTRGQTRTLQIKLARTVATAPGGILAGYNDEIRYSSLGSSIGVTYPGIAELTWDGSPEGSVTGYSVSYWGYPVTSAYMVPGCTQSFKTSCIDWSYSNGLPAGSVMSYSVNTHYTDAAGTARVASTRKDVTVPGTRLPTQYWFDDSTDNSSSNCAAGSAVRDLIVNPKAGGSTATIVGSSSLSSLVGCMTPFSSTVQDLAMTPGTGTLELWYKNTAATGTTCSWPWALYTKTASGGVTQIEGNANSLGDPALSIPGGGSSATPQKVTLTFNTTARTLAPGETLSLKIPGWSSTGNCGNLTFYGNYHSGSTRYQSAVTLPLIGSNDGPVLKKPGTPTDLTVIKNGDGTRTLQWSEASGAAATEFYRIYRDGRDSATNASGVYGSPSNRYDTAGATQTCPSDATKICWTDTDVGNAQHTYRVTAVTAALAESPQTAAVTATWP